MAKNTKPYLEVIPEERQWITMDTFIRYIVNTNRDWRVE